jgi:hypothetical protein
MAEACRVPEGVNTATSRRRTTDVVRFLREVHPIHPQVANRHLRIRPAAEDAGTAASLT